MTDLRKLQLIQCDIVSDIDRVCEEHGLKYYITAGTLLGAVRHKGFIPWDDDMDVVMYREDYNTLIRIFREQYAEKYFVQTFESDPHYTRYIAKIRLNGTTMVESFLDHSKANAGVYVDIFPLDHVRKNDGLELKMRGFVLRWLFAFKSVKHGAQIRKSGVRFWLGKVFRWTTFLVPDVLVNRLFAFVCEKDNRRGDCPYTTNFASGYKWKRQMFENCVYGEGCRLEFEGRMYCAPSEYITLLKQLYGENFMQLPPVEKRVTHNIIKLDLGPYGQSIDE